ncbi:MAG: Zn-dependent alcohol dehydrogenase, partial [Oscillospiraceae bacterium]|nr:Zn-dependent alcohol dehydrogenase [Oscillospiraceae bacterium]
NARVRELTDGYGPTVVMNAAFFKGSLLSACQVAGNAARVMVLGFSIAPDEINQFVITSKELDLRGSRLQNRKFQEVIDLINTGRIDLRGSISHTYHFLDAQKAFDFNDTKDPSIRKIAFTFD